MFAVAATWEATPEAKQLMADVRWALQRAGMSIKEAAYEAGQLDEAQLTRQLNLREGAHLSLARIASWPAAFWREFVKIQAARHGQRVFDDDIADLVEMVRWLGGGKKRMAKADITETADRRTA